MYYMGAAGLLIIIGVSAVGVNTIMKKAKKFYRNVKWEIMNGMNNFRK